MKTVQILIKGKVQGVFFRAGAKEMADKLNLKGWVKNTAEGDVEIVASGKENDIYKFIEWCKRGSRRAVVTEIIVTQKEAVSFNEFSVRR